jgi:hypothetical protein
LAFFLALLTIFIINLGRFRPLQPATIDTTPILQFLERDQHDKWRFMTLGFGDQMAWLSAQTSAQLVDGNYHSARRLQEMTTRPLERLENSKFKGIEGLGSLQQFLTVPEKYYLKFVFSNDKFYDPIMGDLALGLMRGCMNHFGEKANIKKELITEDGRVVKFTVDIL